MLLCWCAYICSIIETMTPWQFPLNIMVGPEVGTYVISLCRENSLCKFSYLYLKRIFTFSIYLQMAKAGNSSFWEIKTIFFGAVNWMLLQNITTAAYGSMLRIVFANFYVYLNWVCVHICLKNARYVFVCLQKNDYIFRMWNTELNSIQFSYHTIYQGRSIKSI